MDTPRLAPLPRDEWDADTTEQLGKMITSDGGQPLNIFATIANHPKLLKRWLVFATHVLSKSELPARDRELLILRAGWLCQAPYEWGQHVVIGREAGITDEEIQRIALGPRAEGWDASDAALLRAADEMHTAGTITDATWATLAERFTTKQLLEVPFAVGQYHLVSFALNSCRVPLDAGIEGLPTSPPGARVGAIVFGADDAEAAAAGWSTLLERPKHRTGATRWEIDLEAMVLAIESGRPGGGRIELVVPDPGALAERAWQVSFAVDAHTITDPWGNAVQAIAPA